VNGGSKLDLAAPKFYQMESFQSNLIDLQPSFDHIVPKPPDFALGKVQMVKHGVILTHELLEEE
jgi:hypothetical protein